MKKPTIHAIRNDQRGAVMVVAAFMAAFLVGGLWYVAGVGNAALFRESMQSGADAGAFAAAVFHARGMNIIAMINLIMAAILGVLVALKIAYLLLTITAAILSFICGIPTQQWACPLALLANNGANVVNKIIKSVEPAINKTLVALSKLQVGVAKVMPVVALAKSNEMAKKYSKPVEGGLMISDSLIPTNGFGLPVEEDKYSVLCEKAAEFVAEFALSPLSLFGVPTKWAKGLVKGFVSMAPSYFCGDSGGSGNMPSNVEAAAKQICDAEKQAIDDYNKNNKKKKMSHDYDECIKKNTKDLKQKEGQTFGGSNSGSGGKTPKKVKDGAQNGNRYFQIITYAWGDMKLANMGRGQVKVAAWGKTVVKPPSFWGKIQFAQAEYYYDDSGSWDSLKEDAMWNMKWRARLRRYHKEIAPGGEIVSKAMSLMSVPAGVLDAIDFLQSGGIDNLLGSMLPGQNKKSLSTVYTKQGTKTDGNNFEKIDTGKTLAPIH
ncbi:MAG: hypothetical protein RMJ98_05125 [Myxococcales bacterium]|nr:hypothetical protein [Polyangiaceae bacterium]MDW8248671.1 hypothetical protein [Myxococcales bacterium]